VSFPFGPVELACSVDHGPLDRTGDTLRCADGHEYPVAKHEIPVMLVRGERATHPVLDVPIEKQDADIYEGEGIDPRVSGGIRATSGYLYNHMIGRMTEYPIPEIRLPPGEGRKLLDVGCHWGRWSVAAQRRGYKPVGIDPSLSGIAAARSVARHLGVEDEIKYVVGDARHLPFADGTFDTVWSYGVFQHFTKEDVLTSFDEIARVLKPGGTTMMQFANVWGARSLMNQVRERRFREPKVIFDVRYWSPGELKKELERRVGPTKVFTDGYITLNPQPADTHLMPRHLRAVVHGSEALRKLSDRFKPLVTVADSVYVIAQR
jgi:ubiquinone/menaquinone biosynthesis C-methylase UbiE